MNLTLEQIFIAKLILQNEQIPEVRSLMPDSSFFEDDICAKYYDAILSTHDIEGRADLILINEELKLKELSEVDLQRWTTQVDIYTLPLKYAGKIVEKYMKRIGSTAIIELHKNFSSNPRPAESLEESITILSDLRSQFIKERSIPLSTVAEETCESIEKLYTGKSESLSFGFADIDNITGGMDKGNLIIYAALQKRGKSTMMLQTLFHNAMKGIPCLLFSTEMKREDLMLRYSLIRNKISWLDFKHKKLSATELHKFKNSILALGKYPIYVSDRVVNILDIISESDRTIGNKGIKLIAVDYIQRVVPVNKKSNENREREIASITNGLKNIAFKHNIPLIALSQLNDDLRSRESRAIEQEMDKMITVNAEEKDEKSADGTSVIIGIRIQQRMGISGGFNDTKMMYDKCFGYWKSYIGIDNEEQRNESTQTSF